MDLQALKARLTPVTQVEIIEDYPSSCKPLGSPSTKNAILGPDIQDYVKALMLLDECNDVLILFEEIKIGKSLREKLVNMRKELTAFMTYEAKIEEIEEEF